MDTDRSGFDRRWVFAVAREWFVGRAERHAHSIGRTRRRRPAVPPVDALGPVL